MLNYQRIRVVVLATKASSHFFQTCDRGQRRLKQKICPTLGYSNNFNTATENGTFIDDLPIIIYIYKKGDLPQLC